MKPIVGISVDCSHDPDDPRTRGKLQLNWNYAQAVADAGGVPILIPPVADPAELAPILDGWLIPGGDDIDARLWGEENHPKVSLIERERFESERAIMNALPQEAPVLGICYGCQFLNVMRGGSLIQHLPDEVGHDGHAGGTLQAYTLERGSRLANLVGGGCVEGKSYHHQAIRVPGEGLTVVAQSEDGVVEAIEADDRPWLVGVQWHPERTLEDEATRRLFEGFIRAAAEYRAKKRT